MRYIVYIRVSTKEQEHSGLGIEAQRHACLEWIKKNSTGHEKILEFKDTVSGLDPKDKELANRPRLVEALVELKQGDVFICYKRERLARNPDLISLIEKQIKKKKATLVSSTGEMDGDEPQDILRRRVIDMFAEYEALVISMRTKMALAVKKRKGEHLGHVPYGKTYDIKKKQVKDNPEEIKVVQEIKELFEQGHTCRKVAQILNDRGYRNRPKKGAEIGDPWTHGAVHRMYTRGTESVQFSTV